MMNSQILDYYVGSLCQKCSHLCHQNNSDPVLRHTKRNDMAATIYLLGVANINRELEKHSLPLFLEIKNRQYDTPHEPEASKRIGDSLWKFSESTLTRFEYEKKTVMTTKTVSERILVDTVEYEEDEPIYTTETKYRKETYDETIYEDKPVTKSKKVEKPYEKKINKPMYNNFTHRTEDRWYTEHYTDVSYQNHTTTERVSKTVTKERTVPYNEKKLVGTRRVTKQKPVYEIRERKIQHPVAVFQIKETNYTLKNKNISCSSCQCKNCVWFTLDLRFLFKCCLPWSRSSSGLSDYETINEPDYKSIKQ